MATTPNPSTTEWVPLWDLNGTPVGDTGPHHATHEPGGTDAIVGAAWLNQANIFTASPQTISTLAPILNFIETVQPIDSRLFRIIGNGLNLRVDAVNDAQTAVQSTPLTMFRNGDIKIGGNALITKIRPELQLQYTGDVTKTHIERHIPNAMVIGDNLSYDGANWNRDNTAIPGTHIVMNTGGTYFRNITAPGTNPAILTDTLRIDATGVVTSAAGNIRVTSTRPMFESQYPGNPVVARIGQVVAGNRIDIMSNLSYDGASWLSDDTTAPSVLYVQQGGEHTFYTLTAGTGPRTPLQQFRVGAATASFAVPLTVSAGLGSTPLNASNITSGTVPDTALSANVALLNVYNTFAPIQVFSGTQPELRMYAADQPANSRVWRIIDTGGNLYFQATDDPITIQQGAVTIGRTGILTAGAGLGGTPLNAAQLTSGIVPVARYQSSGWFYPVVGGSGGESGQDYKYQSGYWIRVGDVYHVWAYTQFRGPGGGAGVGGAPDGHVGAKGNIVGNLQLKGIPACGNPPGAPPSQWPPYATTGAPFAAGGLPYYTNQQPGDTVGMFCYTAATLNYAFMYRLRPNSNNANAMTTNDINDDSQFMFYLFYFAA